MNNNTATIQLFFDNDYFSLYYQEGKVLISVHEEGYDIKDFDKDILERFPRIQINNFIMLKDSLTKTIIKPVEIGVLKPEVEVIVSPDKMEARIKLNLSKEELEDKKDNIEEMIFQALREKNVSQGILYDVLDANLQVQKEYIIAKGILPIDGENAKVKYIDISDRKPVVREDGKVDHYELNLVQQVKEGNWVGEKIPATGGTAGKTVKNEILDPKAGKDQSLRFDSNTIKESLEDGKIILRALVDGAVAFEGGKIKVLNHLIIDGDVDFDTGNINFNGYVTIKGVVCDGFTVKADKDISILGNIGIGAAKEIISREGSIYIKGGISGKGRTVIKAKNSVFVKYVNDCTIIAEQDINIGLYSMEADLHAKNIIVNSEKGRIIGGSLNAEAKVSVFTIGNISERRTFINVKGFNRKKLKEELDKLLLEYREELIKLEKNRRQMKVYEMKLSTSKKRVQSHEYKAYKRINDQLLEKIAALEKRRKALMDSLNSRGEGEVNIFKQAYPQTFLEIKNIQKRIEKATRGTYFVLDNELHFS